MRAPIISDTTSPDLSVDIVLNVKRHSDIFRKGHTKSKE